MPILPSASDSHPAAIFFIPHTLIIHYKKNPTIIYIPLHCILTFHSLLLSHENKRLWNEVRHYQTMRSSFASQQRYDMDFGHGDWNPPSPPPAPQQAQQQAQQSKSAEVPVVLDDEFALSLLPADLVEVDMGHVVDWDEEIEDESSSSEEEEANARKRRDSSHEEDKDRRASKRRKDQSVPPFEADDSTTPTSAGPILSDSLSAATSPVIAPA
jgi:hypothetical protein